MSKQRDALGGGRLVGLAALLLIAMSVLILAEAPRGLALIGLLLCAPGVWLIAVAQRQMGESFRIGIDDAKTRLVRVGLFRLVRNPIYSGLLVMLFGVTLVIPCAASILLGLAAAAAIAFHTRLEERHLLALHGDAYRRYAACVGRFVPGVGRLRA